MNPINIPTYHLSYFYNHNERTRNCKRNVIFRKSKPGEPDADIVVEFTHFHRPDEYYPWFYHGLATVGLVMDDPVQSPWHRFSKLYKENLKDPVLAREYDDESDFPPDILNDMAHETLEDALDYFDSFRVTAAKRGYYSYSEVPTLE